MNISFVATNHIGQSGTIIMPVGYDLSGYTLSVDICPDTSFSPVTHQGTVSYSAHTITLSFTAAEVDAIQNCYFRIKATGPRTFYVFAGQILYAPVAGFAISDASIDGTGYLGPAANLSNQQVIDSLGTDQTQANTVVRRDSNGNSRYNRLYLEQDTPVLNSEATTKQYVDAGDHREFLHATVGGGQGDAAFTIGSSFTTVPLSTVDYDTAGGFNTSTGIYSVAATGYYDINATLRVVDGGPANLQVGMGVGTNNADSPTFVWNATSAATRTTFTYARNARFVAGDQVRLFAYVDAGAQVSFAAASLSLSLIGK